jgi:long-chain acyl-CoA synthetase
MPLITSEMISTISYTSGTTGNPKGVMLSHGNIVSTLGGLTGEEFNLEHEDMHLSYLPMAHIFERLVVYCCLLSGGAFGMYSGDMLKLKQDM